MYWWYEIITRKIEVSLIVYILKFIVGKEEQKKSLVTYKTTVYLSNFMYNTKNLVHVLRTVNFPTDWHVFLGWDLENVY